MLFMNTYDIDDAVRRHRNHPVLGKAARVLADWRDTVDANSDGWSSWPGGANAAARLMQLIQAGGDPSDAQLRQALAPIRACVTRQKKKYGAKLVCPEIH